MAEACAAPQASAALPEPAAEEARPTSEAAVVNPEAVSPEQEAGEAPVAEAPTPEASGKECFILISSLMYAPTYFS